jgi:integrase
MKRTKRLSARTVDTAKPGKYADGNGLYLIVSPSGARKWVFRYMRNGRAREMGLGRASGGTLAETRRKALEAQSQLAGGIDPLAQKKRGTGAPTFGQLATEVRESLSAGFRNAKHKAQWKNTLETYAAPLKDLKVDAIETEHVLECLRPIWTQKPETASRVRGRIEKVLDAARAKGYRTAENPARWRGHLDHLLPRPKKLAKGHHASIRYQMLPALMAQMREREAIAALALEFCILTASRTSEVLNACWEEIDLTEQVWTIPAARMKAGKVHRIPLSSQAMKVLEKLSTLRTGEHIFPSQNNGKPLSQMSMVMLLRRMKVSNITVHGFRSTFRDWAGNETKFPRELAEHALAHTIGDKAEQAYRRSDALERRRELMQAWADFCDSRGSDQENCGASGASS